MEERRSKPRLTVSLNAVWDSSNGNHPARITDLSLGGCYLDTVGETMTGEIVCFRVSLPDGDWLYLEGEVRHHRLGMGFGVRFLDLEQQQEEKIEGLLKAARESGNETDAIVASLVED
jgi:PilZ domain